MKKFRNIAVILVIICFVVIIASCTYYNINIGKVSDDTTLKEITIEAGSVDSIANTLKDNDLIKNKTMFKVYVKLTGKTNLKAGVYELSENMGTKTIVNILEKGSKISPGEVQITFREGINIREIASIVEEKLGIKSSDFISTVNDKEYIKELINKYWFLTDDILNSKIYYPLEGYLFPSTYEFYKNSTSKDVVTKMLNEMDKLLSNYKTDIEKSSYSIHEIMTLASIVELEGKNDSDRDLVASVFNNRVKGNWSLGSDVTTYYYLKIDDFKTSLNGNKDLYTCDYAYNTRCTSFKGLPVGPICSSGKVSITSSINIKDSSYYYFVADCKGKVYFNTNSSGHYNTINKLKADGNWCS